MNSDQRHIFIHYYNGSHVNHFPAGTGMVFSCLKVNKVSRKQTQTASQHVVPISKYVKESSAWVICLLSKLQHGLLLFHLIQSGFVIATQYSFGVKDNPCLPW